MKKHERIIEGADAKERCPVFPSNAIQFHHNFPDPAKATGTPEEIIQNFREVRDFCFYSCISKPCRKKYCCRKQ
jgi:hypothetical protein